MIKIIVSGIAGRMGKKTADLSINDPEIELVGGVEATPSSYAGLKVESDLGKIIKKADCVVEFTTPAATCEHAGIAKAEKKAMVIGTTGLDETELNIIKDASKRIPIVFSPNMSIGVNLLFKLISDAAGVLGKGYGVKVEETHHVHKKDAPSGTAKKLAEIIKSNKKDGLDNVDIKSNRVGEIVGDHTVKFTGEYEVLELSHSAKSRDVFAQGALLAAKFIVTKKRGLYTMADVLGLKNKG